MRILLLADVHANWEALLALQRAEPQPDVVLFAGDAVGFGPDPVACLRWLQANAHGAVRGDHDDAMLTGELAGAGGELEWAARESLAHTSRVLGADQTDVLMQWPLSLTAEHGGSRFYLVHGTPAEPLYGQLNPALCPEAELHTLFDSVPADLIVVGHTHLPAIRRFGQRWVVNPGSLGQPRYGVSDATYAVWEDGDLRIRHLHYDHDATASKLRLMAAVGALSAEVMEQLTPIIETGLVKEPQS